MKKFVSTIVLAMIVTLIAPISPVRAATYTVSGVVTCASLGNVQGVWIQSSAGGSTWADWWAIPGRPTSAYFSKTVSFSGTSTTISLHTGCGRSSTGSWLSTNLTPNVTVSRNRILNNECRPATAGRAQTCTWAPSGPVSTFNMGIAGYCTWGAYELWKQNVGAYPKIGGNAIDMDDNAKGFRVTSIPQPRSLIVFNSGSFGHVGWVTGISKNSNGQVVIAFTDMNGSATFTDVAKGITTDFNKYVARTKIWDPNVQRFIVAAP